MKAFFFALGAAVLLSSCVSVRFPEEIEVKVEFPQNASPEQIKAVMSGMSGAHMNLHHQKQARIHLKIDSLGKEEVHVKIDSIPN